MQRTKKRETEIEVKIEKKIEIKQVSKSINDEKNRNFDKDPKKVSISDRWKAIVISLVLLEASLWNEVVHFIQQLEPAFKILLCRDRTCRPGLGAQLLRSPMSQWVPASGFPESDE